MSEQAIKKPGLSEQEIDLRKRWLSLDASDEQFIREIDAHIALHLDEIIEKMYGHFFAFEETREFFPDEETLNRAKTAQRAYFDRLAKGAYGQEYVQDRLRVGATHYRVDLDPKWYIGAYNHVLSTVSDILLEAYRGNLEGYARAMTVVRKLAFFDMTLAIDTYIQAKEEAIRQHRDALAELQTERRVTKNILESAPIGIVQLDSDLICRECNEEFRKMLDPERREEAVGTSLFELAPKLSRGVFDQVLATGQPYQATAEVLHLSSSGSRDTYWDWAAWPMRDDGGQTNAVVAVFTNVTDRVLLQQQREDFVATLTHDLKTPILAANRAVKLLMEGDFGEISEPQARILDTIHQSNEALYKLVQTLLDVYRYDSGVKQLSMTAVDIAETIGKMTKELKPLADAKQISLELRLPDKCRDVLCDEEEIRRVIQNLVDNSLKYTPAGGSVVIELEQPGDKTLVRVTDTGKGIRSEEMPKLFQRFWQAAASGRYYASTGLGLYLCRKIVELHNGEIWCESEVGKGSSFWFSIGTIESASS